MSLFHKILLSLNIIYCLFGAITKSVPAWRMFEQVESLNIEVRNGKGQLVQIRNYLPKNSYLTSMKTVLKIVTYICLKKTDDGPFTVTRVGQPERFTSNRSSCEFTP